MRTVQGLMLVLMYGWLVLSLMGCGGEEDHYSVDDDPDSGAHDPDDSVDDDADSDNETVDDTLNDDAGPDDDFADDDMDDDAINDDAADDDLADDDTADDDITDDDTTDDDTSDDDTVPPTPTTIGGYAYSFDPGMGMLAGSEVSVVERPDILPAITDENGYFYLDNVYAGEEMTLQLTHDDYFTTRTATLLPPAEGMTDISIQVPPTAVVWVLALFLLTPLDLDSCQIAATVSPAGGTIWTPGVAGARVLIEPSLPAHHGPFYFLYLDLPNWPPIDLPVRWLTETTDDGGAVFVNVPPGDYVLTAEKDGWEFSPAVIHCRAGLLINASPPYGLQAVEESDD